MSIDIASIRRKGFLAKTVQVTPLNIEEVTKWCRGRILEGEKEGNFSRQFIKVRVAFPADDSQTEAHVGDWIVKRGQSFKVYKDKPFRRTFEYEDGTEIAEKKQVKVEAPKGPSPSMMPSRAAEVVNKIAEDATDATLVEKVQEVVELMKQMNEPAISEVLADEPKSQAMTLDELNSLVVDDEPTPGEVFRGEA